MMHTLCSQDLHSKQHGQRCVCAIVTGPPNVGGLPQCRRHSRAGAGRRGLSVGLKVF